MVGWLRVVFKVGRERPTRFQNLSFFLRVTSQLQVASFNPTWWWFGYEHSGATMDDFRGNDHDWGIGRVWDEWHQWRSRGHGHWSPRPTSPVACYRFRANRQPLMPSSDRHCPFLPSTFRGAMGSGPTVILNTSAFCPKV